MSTKANDLVAPPKWGRFYVWQTHMYGTGKVDACALAEVYMFRPMPCTPAGDFVGVVRTGAAAKLFVERFNRELPTLDVAAKIIRDDDDLSLPRCQDCKWPELSRAAKACPCSTGDSSDAAAERHRREVEWCRKLKDEGVPYSDPRWW